MRQLRGKRFLQNLIGGADLKRQSHRAR